VLVLLVNHDVDADVGDVDVLVRLLLVVMLPAMLLFWCT